MSQQHNDPNASPTPQQGAPSDGQPPAQPVPPAPSGWHQPSSFAGQPGQAQPGQGQMGQPGQTWQPGPSFPPPHAGYAYAPMQPVPQKKSHGWIVALVAMALVFALFAMSIHSCTSVFTTSMGMTSTPSEADSLTQDAVAVITLDGTIAYDGSACSPDGLKELLDQAEQNDHIKAVVLRVNSGGGSAAASEEMANYVRDFGKPIVVSSMEANASGAYEISSQADYIYASETTLVGSIGTIVSITDTSELMDKLGINIQEIASAGSKTSSSGNRPLTEDERAHYQQIVDRINETFIAKVAQGRNMTEEEVRELATGLTYDGAQALQYGLVDATGTKEDALVKAADLAGLSAYYAVVDLELDYTDLSSMLGLLGESDVSAQEAAEAVKEQDEYGILAN